MVQRETLVMWRSKEEESLDFYSIANRAYQCFQILCQGEEDFRPNYQTRQAKQKPKSVPLEQQAFYEYVMRKRVKAPTNMRADELGYTFSMYSSEDSGRSSSFMFHVGGKDSVMPNSIIIGFPTNRDFSVIQNAQIVRDLFDKLTVAFEPFWGCVYNSLIHEQYHSFINDSDNIPTTIHWLNYFSPDFASTFEGRIDAVIEHFPEASYRNGVLCLRPVAFDANNPEDVEYQHLAHETFRPTT